MEMSRNCLADAVSMRCVSAPGTTIALKRCTPMLLLSTEFRMSQCHICNEAPSAEESAYLTMASSSNSSVATHYRHFMKAHNLFVADTCRIKRMRRYANTTRSTCQDVAFPELHQAPMSMPIA